MTNEETEIVMNVLSLLAVTAGLFYFVGLLVFVSRLKRHEDVWSASGRPAILNPNGQAKLMSLIFRLASRKDAPPGLGRLAIILRTLLFVAIPAFIAFVLTALKLKSAS